jgi:hypothetical protein
MKPKQAGSRGRSRWKALLPLALAGCLLAGPPARAAMFGDMLGALAGRSVGGYSEPGALNDAIARLAVQLNSATPQELGNDVRLDGVSAKQSELTYHYTLLGIAGAELPQSVFNTRMANAVRERLCQDPQSLRLLKSGARIGYAYRGRDGSEIGKLSFEQRDCGGSG